MAWLAGVGPPPSSDDLARQTLEKINSLIKGIHFCIANTGSVSPKNLAENLANQLTAQVEGYSDVLVASLFNKVQFNSNIVIAKPIQSQEFILKSSILGD
jgi:hypothetical protein